LFPMANKMLFPMANKILTANSERRKQLLRPRIKLKFVFNKRYNNPVLTTACNV